jgi:hypothetical protein
MSARSASCVEIELLLDLDNTGAGETNREETTMAYVASV